LSTTIDWFGRIGHIVAEREQIRQIDKIAALLLGSGEYVGNDHRQKVSHLVPSVDELSFGDQAATYCGQLVSGADLFPDYEWCAECVDSESSGSST
jgi:hypothetical protein